MTTTVRGTDAHLNGAPRGSPARGSTPLCRPRAGFQVPAGLGRGKGRTGGATLLVPAVHDPEPRPVDPLEARVGERRPFEEAAVEDQRAVKGHPAALGRLLAAAPGLDRLVVVGHV